MRDAGYWILDRRSTPSQIGLIIQHPASSIEHPASKICCTAILALCPGIRVELQVRAQRSNGTDTIPNLCGDKEAIY
jgi:hypothetical protein